MLNEINVSFPTFSKTHYFGRIELDHLRYRRQLYQSLTIPLLELAIDGLIW